MKNRLPIIEADWPAPPGVHALTTTRIGGVSVGPYASLNLATHVEDDPAAVRENRARLRAVLDLPAEPLWLKQVHGTHVIDAGAASGEPEADGASAFRPGVVCTVLTADCLPVFLCDCAGSRVAVLHAGWRGLAAGVIEAGIRALQLPPAQLLAWLGPAIGPQAFEVGPEVRAAFMAHDAAAAAAFVSGTGQGGRWLADIYVLARQRLAAAGVSQVSGGGLCTYSASERFYSYRREHTCGRMASLIWLKGRPQP